jgi:hypothetical protein
MSPYAEDLVQANTNWFKSIEQQIHPLENWLACGGR